MTARHGGKVNASAKGKGTVGRRDFLKYTAVAGAVAGVSLQLGSMAAAGGVPAAEAATATENLGRNVNWSFGVDIPGLPETSANVVAVQAEDLTIDVRETTTGLDVEYRTYAPGDAHYGKLTIRSRVGKNSKELLQWLQDASVGKNVRKDISVIIKDRAGSEARRFNLMECFPVKFDPGDYSPSSTVAVETIVCVIGRAEYA